MSASYPVDICPVDVFVADLRNESTEDVDLLLYTPAEEVLITIVMPIIWVIGVAANLAFIFVVYRLRRMRTVTNYYLLNLAVADIMFLCFAIGDKFGRFFASPVADDQFGLKPVGCALVNYFVQLSFYASIFLVTLVTLEKYYAICRPVMHRLVSGKKRTVRTTVVAWLVATAFAASLIPSWIAWTPLCILWPDEDKYTSFPNVIGACLPFSQAMSIVGNGLQTVPFFIVMVANFVMYGLIIRAVRTRVAVREQQQGAAAIRTIQMRNQVTRMLIINGVIFFILLAPYQFAAFSTMIIGAVGDYLLNNEQHTKVIWTMRILSYLNSASNPFVYTLVNRRYRDAFLEVYACCPSMKMKMKRKLIIDNGGSMTTYDIDKKDNINRQEPNKSNNSV